VTGEQIVALRKEIGCTRKQLAAELRVTPELVTDWELGRRFATRRVVRQLARLRERRQPAVAPGRSGQAGSAEPLQALLEPELWQLLRKLLAYPELRRRASALADEYED